MTGKTSRNEQYDFTVVSQSSYERVYFLPFWVERWNGPISMAFFLYGEGAHIYQQAIQQMDIPKRMNVIAYFGDSANPYPINMLRNIAMDHVTTSHFWLADMDMWPAYDLYNTLVSLPHSFLSRDDAVTIVPAFEYNLPKGTVCDSFTGCINNIKEDLPKVKADLQGCLSSGHCSRFREASKTHSYHFDEWYTLPSDTFVTPLPCLFNDIQEPYVFVKLTERTPHFDERFVNYGKNKVQWITHLRLLGYQFYVLSQSFAIDVPHPRSQIAKDWFSEGEKTNWKTKMHVLVDAFTQEIVRETTNVPIQTPLCSGQ